jgi:hypothetical protein
VKNHQTITSSENGNAIFLVLIAIALFAGLSYAVTQAKRSSEEAVNSEKAILSSAAMTQYPAALRTSVVRMVFSGINVSKIKFNAPENFGDTPEELMLFHPNGGGAPYRMASADVMKGAEEGQWFINANWDVPEVGVSGSGAGNDLIAFLPNINQAVCVYVNKELGVSNSGCISSDTKVPDLDVSTDSKNIRQNADGSYNFPTTDQEDLQNASASCMAFKKHASGCFFDKDYDEYVYYSVILQR